jgi:hypothetical protein
MTPKIWAAIWWGVIAGCFAIFILLGVALPSSTPSRPAMPIAAVPIPAPKPLDAPAAALAPWLELRQGVRAYTGDDGGGASALTVCPSAYFYKKWFANSTAVVPECTEKPRGVPVTIVSDEIILSGLVGEYFVFIRADDSPWSGWTGSLGLQPRVPANTKVVVKTLVPGGEKWFFPNKTSAAGHIVLVDGATLQILAQDPKSNGPDLYAQVIGGSGDTGKKGWLHSLGLDVQGDGPLLFAPPNRTKAQR